MFIIRMQSWHNIYKSIDIIHYDKKKEKKSYSNLIKA